ncbi:MAG: uridine kinase [Clostridia bacterium]|nr:uridine kinase [Clostridia bacterium]
MTERLKGEILRLLKARDRVIIGIDGNAAAGKSTLAAALCDSLDATLIHMDDYFLPPSLRTQERLSQAGGNIHYERFTDEVITPIREGRRLSLRRYDCHEGLLLPARTVELRPVVIIEGSYALHPLFSDIYDIKLVLSIDPLKQRKRIEQREGREGAQAFFDRWIPLENAYLAELKLPRDKIVTR